MEARSLMPPPASRPHVSGRSGSPVVPSAARGRHPGRRALTALLVGVLVLLLVRTWVAEPLRIPSDSMAPTLQSGEHVIAEKLSVHVGSWRRGEIVVFASPVDQALLAKRIVGLAGDRVAIRDGRLFLNGHRIDEPYTDPDAIDSVYYGPVRVPADEVLVMGDNRANSVDSRTFGTVPTSQIQGRVAAVVWPPRQAHLIDYQGGLP
jgi:signal peptidase I